MRSVVRRDDGQSYADDLEALAKQSGIETPTREDIAKVDRKRKMETGALLGVTLHGVMRRRGELLERPFAHMHETGGMRRTHLSRHDDILNRLLIHAAGLNLSLDA